MRLGIAVLFVPALAAADAPARHGDCSQDLVSLDEESFTVAVACRGEAELVFERRDVTPKQFEERARNEAAVLGASRTKLSVATARGAATGYAMSFDGGAHVLVRRGNDVYACTSVIDVDACRALVETFGKSLVVRRGPAAFSRPKS